MVKNFFFSVLEAERKWENLRIQFFKELRLANQKGKSGAGGGAKSESKWRYFNALSFLEKHSERRRTITNLQVFTKFYFIYTHSNIKQTTHFIIQTNVYAKLLN